MSITGGGRIIWDWDEFAGRAFMALENDLLPELVDAAPEGATGLLRAGIRSREDSLGDWAKWEATSDSPYYPFVRHGTAPHDIEAAHLQANGKPGLLHFEVGGMEVFTPHVNHPGNAANSWPQEVWSAMEGRITDAFRQAVRQTIRVESQT